MDPGRRPGPLLCRPVDLEGLTEGGEWMAGHTAEAVKRWVGDEGLPVVTEPARARTAPRLEDVEVLDSIEWVTIGSSWGSS